MALLAALAAATACRRGDRGGRSEAPAVPGETRAGGVPGDGASAPPAFVGRQACASCHPREAELWTGSHHDLAMQEATPQTVLGNFKDARFVYHGIVTTFSTRDGQFVARTDGPDGALGDYPIAYTFGVEPLQQYLIPFPGGRTQALNVCWDTRPLARGGQRWFHLHPDENVTHDDVLHWTGPYGNWNHMCAECHSTGVRKNYVAAEDRFETSWSEIDVSCEACHGPGSAHVAWASSTERESDSDGLPVRLRDPESIVWVMNPSTGIAAPDRPRRSRAEVESCARCHARRSVLAPTYEYGRPLADTHRPALLDAVLYEDDGQIKDEVYEYGSFLQSRMYAAGVTCSDCHDPHSLKPAGGNAVCARCHLPGKFDTPAHHFHRRRGAGSACVDCHMATRNYMVVDARHDHSFRVPRPDLSLSIGVPNACARCHANRSARWLAETAAKWWGTGRSGRPHYGTALHAGRRGLPGAAALLEAVIGDAAQPGIVRATAAGLLGDVVASPRTLPTLERALGDPEPLLRDAAVNALRQTEEAARARLLAPLLSDPVRLVRIDAGRALATVTPTLLGTDRQAAAARALDEWRAEQEANADRAEAHLTLGALHAERGETADAEREDRTALRLSPRFPPAYLNLADLYRQQEREAEAERTLREGLRVAPGDAALLHGLGLSLVRQGRLPEALTALERAAAAAPDVSRYAYVYGVALHSAGRTDRSLAVLEDAHARRPGDPEILVALATISRDAGRRDEALRYARRLVALAPDDPQARRLLAELEPGAR